MKTFLYAKFDLHSKHKNNGVIFVVKPCHQLVEKLPMDMLEKSKMMKEKSSSVFNSIVELNKKIEVTTIIIHS